MLTGEIKSRLEHIAIFPASHYVVPQEKIERAAKSIEKELEERVRYFKSNDKLLEAQRIAERTNFDIEMMPEVRKPRVVTITTRVATFAIPKAISLSVSTLKNCVRGF